MGLFNKKNQSPADARRDAQGKAPGKLQKIKEPGPHFSQQEEDELRNKLRVQMFGGRFGEKVKEKMAEACFGEMRSEDGKLVSESEQEASGTDQNQEDERNSYLDKNETKQCVSRSEERDKSSNSRGQYSEKDDSLTDDDQGYAKPSVEYERSQPRVSSSLSSFFSPFNTSSDPFVERTCFDNSSHTYRYAHSDNEYAHSNDDYSSQADVLDEYAREYPDIEFEEGDYGDHEVMSTKNLFQVPPPPKPRNRTYQNTPASARFRRPTLGQHLSDYFQSTGFDSKGVKQGQHQSQPRPNSLYTLDNVHIASLASLSSTNRESTVSTYSHETLRTLTPRASLEKKSSLVVPDPSPAARFDEKKHPFPSFTVSTDEYEKFVAYEKVRNMLLERWFDSGNSIPTLTPWSSDPCRLHGMHSSTLAKRSVRFANRTIDRGGIGNWSGSAPRSPKPDSLRSSSASFISSQESSSIKSAISGLCSLSVSSRLSLSPPAATSGSSKDKGKSVWAPRAREVPSIRALRIARSVLQKINSTFGSPAAGTFNSPDLVPETIASFKNGLLDARRAECKLERDLELYTVANKSDVAGNYHNVAEAAAYKRMMDRYEKGLRDKIMRKKIEETKLPSYGYEAAWAVRFVEWAEQWEKENRKLREYGLREMLVTRGPQAGELGWKTRQEDEDEDEEGVQEKSVESEEGEYDARKRMQEWAAEVNAGFQREKERQIRDAQDSKHREAERKAEMAAQKEKINEWNRQLKEMEAKEKQRQKR